MKIESLSLGIVMALAGLGLFLVAIKLMSGSLKKMSGGFTAKMVGKIGQNQWVGLMFGIVFTTMIQSSDGAVALAIGLIGAGMLTLRSAIPFLLGANIGTATTALIVALGSVGGAVGEIVDYLNLFVFFGAAMMLFVNEEKKVNIAMLIFAVGSIFLGLKIMGAGMKVLTAQDWFKDMVRGVGVNPWAAMFANTAFTGVVQSSSATVTVVQGMTDSGELTLITGIAMVIGANIGTTFTALITSIGASKDARRVAVVWLLTNTATALLIMPIITQYAHMIEMIPPMPLTGDGVTAAMQHSNAIKWQIAYAHLFFNCILTFIFIWLVRPLVWFANVIIKEKKTAFAYNIHLQKELIIQSPELAFQNALGATYELGRMTSHSAELLLEYYSKKDPEVYKKYLELNELINMTRTALYAYLVELGSKDISKKTSDKHLSVVLACRSLERIPILGAELAASINNTLKKGKFDITDEDYMELKELLKAVKSVTDRAVISLQGQNKTNEDELTQLASLIDDLVTKYSSNHIARATQKRTTTFDFMLAAKLCSRMSHHAVRVNNYMNPKKVDEDITKISAKLEKELMREI